MRKTLWSGERRNEEGKGVHNARKSGVWQHGMHRVTTGALRIVAFGEIHALLLQVGLHSEGGLVEPSHTPASEDREHMVTVQVDMHK